MNLRELISKFGRNVGLNVTAVGLYAAQTLDALKHLKSNRVVHADIKPDNILVNDKFSKVKICDFGSAMTSGEIEVTPYLVSRFYRAPEVILGLPYGENNCAILLTSLVSLVERSVCLALSGVICKPCRLPYCRMRSTYSVSF